MAYVDPAVLIHRFVDLDKESSFNSSVEHVIVNKTYPRPVEILVLGGSSMHDAVPDGQNAESVLEQACGRVPKLLNAATSGQHATDGWAIIDALEGPPPKIILVGLSAGRLDVARGDGPYALSGQKVSLPQSPTAVALALQHGTSRVAPFDFFAQIRRLRDTLAVSMAQSALEPGGDLAVKAPSLVSANPVQDYKKHVLLMEDIGNEGEMAAYWTAFAQRMQRRGSQVYFVWTPLSPVGQALDARSVPNKIRALNALSQTAPVVDMSQIRRLTIADFRDTLHLNSNGARKLWPEIVRNSATQGLCKILGDGDRP
jgi:hypothetical protein